MADKKLIYVADPMCSWCWAFEPDIVQLCELIQGRCSFALMMGGLRSETGPVPAERRAMYQQLWPEIESRTGQLFRCNLVESDEFVYDTEPACRATLVVRSLIDDATALQMLGRLQRAFYVDSRDITQAACCAEIASDIGADKDQFLELFSDEATKLATQDEFQILRHWGVTGFPTVILVDGQHGKFLTRGYQPFDELLEPVTNWLDDESDG